MEVNPMPFGEEVTHFRYNSSKKDRYNNAVPGFDPGVVIPGVGVDVVSSAEVYDDTTQRADVELTIFLPPGTQYDSRDEFLVRGSRYQVVGATSFNKNFFTNAMFRTEVNLRRTNG